MSYAVCNDRYYQRAVSSKEDVAEGEYFSELPVEIISAPLTNDQILAAAIDKADQLLSLAAIRIAPLQDAVDLKKPDADTSLLNNWKQYRIDVSRVTTQSGFPSEIIWPVEPS
ncbi:tail fiber assembly protein [Pseudomonas extremaustralis]|uniref:tail fiber assembly protein n=1 Tax=Pseudomonas extremaustralis TaxID=359110 RepID=UPI002AA5ED90|nr:tail fiber assembly protein [Pseudomonas extremaustralis]